MLIQGRIVVDWVVSKGDCFAPLDGCIGVGWVNKGKIVAGVMYEEFTEASIHATIVVEDDHPLTKGFVHAIFHYPFEQLKVGKIIVQMSEAHGRSKKLAEHFGFELEARIKGAYLDGDRLIYSMPVENCKWLKRSNHEKSKNS